MDAKRMVRVSKYLSLHLRHRPEGIGITLQPGGWVVVEELLAACVRNHFSISRAELEAVVETSDKQRFSFDDTGERIRANQGHTSEVELSFEPRDPPPILYHGTAEHNLPSILRDGLLRMKRHHVHLSATVETATAVGRRHGKVIVLEVDAAGFQHDGGIFYLSTNGVWLTDTVPPRYLKRTEGE